MEKNVHIALLYDFYGDILTDKQSDCIDLYYNEDLSLSEISKNMNITRQGVRDNIKRGEATLFKVEEKLGLVKRFSEIQSKASDIDILIREIEKSPAVALLSRDVKENINRILMIVKEIQFS